MKRSKQILISKFKIVAIIIAAFLVCALIFSGVMLFKGSDSVSTVTNATKASSTDTEAAEVSAIIADLEEELSNLNNKAEAPSSDTDANENGVPSEDVDNVKEETPDSEPDSEPEPSPEPVPEPEGEALLFEILIDYYDDGSAKLIKDFSADVTVYRVYVPSESVAPRLTAIAENPNADIVMYVNGEIIDDSNKGKATDTVKLPEVGSEATVKFVVTLDGNPSEYVLTVKRTTATPYLTYLTVGSYQLYDESDRAIDGKDENAVKGVKDFYVTIENADTEVNIVARANAEEAEVRFTDMTDGNYNVGSLFKGTAKADVEISIIPAFGIPVNYTLHLTRKPALSSNTTAFITIDEITDTYYSEIADKKNPISFNDEFLQYSETKDVYGKPYRIPYDVSELTVKITFEDEGELIAPPTYQIFYGDVLKNDNGANDSSVRLAYGVNVVIITIAASDGYSIRTIAVIVYRDEPSLFAGSTINEIPAFAEEYAAKVTSYSYTVSNDVTKLSLQLNYDKSLYTCAVSENANNLKTGLNTVTICLYEIQNSGVSKTAAATDVDGAVRTITLSIYRESNGLGNVWLILFIVFLILAILVFILLLLFLLRNRKDGPTKTKHRIIVKHVPAPAPAPVSDVKVQPEEAAVQYVFVSQPQPANPPKQQPLNVEVNITGCGDSDKHYQTKK